MRYFQFFGQKRVAVVYSSVTGKIAIMSILRAFALSAYKKPETSFYTKFYNGVCPFKISEFQVVWRFTG